MADHPTVQQLKRGYKAFGEGDMNVLTEIIPDDAVWHVPGKSQFAGDYKGRDEIFGYFGKLMELSNGTFKADLVHAVGDDKFGVAIQHTTVTRNGRTYDRHDVLVDRMENGTAVETWVYPEDQYAIDEIGA